MFIIFSQNLSLPLKVSFSLSFCYSNTPLCFFDLSFGCKLCRYSFWTVAISLNKHIWSIGISHNAEGKVLSKTQRFDLKPSYSYISLLQQLISFFSWISLTRTLLNIYLKQKLTKHRASCMYQQVKMNWAAQVNSSVVSRKQCFKILSSKLLLWKTDCILNRIKQCM